mgnify:CR=1 FL=1
MHFSVRMPISETTPVGALIKTTLVDFPGRVACALFLTGCNLRCPYCYNGALVTGSESPEQLTTLGDVLAHLEKRRAVLSGFVISGGEALLYPALPILIQRAKALGYAVKLDTNGTLPDRLAAHIADSATRPDFIAMDLKTSPARYAELLPNALSGTAATATPTVHTNTRSESATGAQKATPSPTSAPPQATPALAESCPTTAPHSAPPLSIHGAATTASTAPAANTAQFASPAPAADYAVRLAESAALIARAYAPDAREWRTVLVPPLVQRADIAAMAELLPPDASWQFAQFRNENCLDSRYNDIFPYSDAEAAALVTYAQSLVAGASLR